MDWEEGRFWLDCDLEVFWSTFSLLPHYIPEAPRPRKGFEELMRVSENRNSRKVGMA